MSDSSKIIIINGPNLNLLGTREPEHYGSKTLKDIKENCIKYVAKKNIELIFDQSHPLTNFQAQVKEYCQGKTL